MDKQTFEYFKEDLTGYIREQGLENLFELMRQISDDARCEAAREGKLKEEKAWHWNQQIMYLIVSYTSGWENGTPVKENQL